MDLSKEAGPQEVLEKGVFNESQKERLKQALIDQDEIVSDRTLKNPPFLDVLNPEFKHGFSTNLEVEFEDSDEATSTETTSPRSKTSLRMHYEAQVKVIQNQLGSLENVRLNLGLSQRKMAQLLMIDPSSWTRWTKKGDEAPPHIWRALQWYSIIQEKIPGLTANYFNGNSPQVLHEESLRQIELERITRHTELAELKTLLSSEASEKKLLEQDIKKLKKDLKFHRNISIFILLISTLWVGLFFIWNYL